MTIKGNHKCAFGSESLLDRKSGARWRSLACRQLRRSIMVSEYHPLAFEYLRSFPALVAERQRHLLEDKNIIHPLSIFSLVWNSYMMVINLSLIIFSSLRLFILIEPVTILTTNSNDIFLLVLQAICFIDMIICFNTGYLECDLNMIELERRRIAWQYIRSYFLPDLISCVPVSALMLLMSNQSRPNYLIPDLMPLARVIRVITVLDNLKTLIRTLTTSYYWYTSVPYILLITLVIHCFTCLLYAPSVLIYYLYGDVPKTYTGFLDTRNVSRSFYDLPSSQRYSKAIFIAVSAFFSTGFPMFRTYEKGEILVNSIILLFGTMVKLYTLVFALKIYMTLYNSTLKYQELMDQVEKYMRHQQFSAPLTRRLRDFYSYRFQERYYKESVALGSLSARLRNEIRLHSLQSWVKKVPVFQDQSPSVLGGLMGCLEPEVYMPNDLVFHVGDIGTCMYFVATGTVALYSMRGVEIYHFEDNDFFGALSLVTSGSRRMTTLIAIEITQVYKLSYDDLRNVNQELFDLIKNTTLERFTRIMKVDEVVFLEELNK